MRRARELALFLGALLLGIGCSTAGTWAFVPSLDLMQRYDSNVILTADNPTGDFITRVGGNFPLNWTGGRSNVNLAYRLGYDAYVENTVLNNLSQNFRAAWGMDAARNRWDLFGSWTRTANPRIGTEVGVDAPPTPGADPSFVATRTQTDYWLVSLGYARTLSPAWRLQVSLDGGAARYDDPRLFGNENYTAVLQADHRSSKKNSWNAGLRYSIYQAVDNPSLGFSAVQGGATHQLSRRITAVWLLGVVLEQGSTAQPGQEELVGEPLSGSDRLYGLASVTGDYRRSNWSFGYNRDFTSGSGVRVAVRRDRFQATAGWNVGRTAMIGLALARSRSQGLDLNVNDDSLDLRYAQPMPDGWGFEVAAGVRQQNGDNNGGAGTFLEKVVAVTFRYAGQKRS